MEKAEFMDFADDVANKDFICKYCEIDETEYERLLALDDLLGMVDVVYESKQLS